MTVRYRDLRERLGCDLQYLNLGVVISTKMHDIDLCIPRPIWSNMLLTPEQCRAGRALLTWTQDDLATRAEVSRSTVRGFESGQHELHRASAAAIRRALEEGGILFINADAEHGPGVRMADRTKGLNRTEVDGNHGG